MYFDKVRSYLEGLSEEDLHEFEKIASRIIIEEKKKKNEKIPSQKLRVAQNVKKFLEDKTDTPYFEEYLMAIDKLGKSSALDVLSGRNSKTHWRDLILAATSHTAMPDSISVHMNDKTVAKLVSDSFQALISASASSSKQQFEKNLRYNIFRVILYKK